MKQFYTIPGGMTPYIQKHYKQNSALLMHGHTNMLCISVENELLEHMELLITASHYTTEKHSAKFATGKNLIQRPWIEANTISKAYQVIMYEHTSIEKTYTQYCTMMEVV